MLAHEHWLSRLRTLGTRPWFGGRLMVSRAHQVFNETGEMTDAAMRMQLQEFLRGFVINQVRWRFSKMEGDAAS